MSEFDELKRIVKNLRGCESVRCGIQLRKLLDSYSALEELMDALDKSWSWTKQTQDAWDVAKNIVKGNDES